MKFRAQKLFCQMKFQRWLFELPSRSDRSVHWWLRPFFVTLLIKETLHSALSTYRSSHVIDTNRALRNPRRVWYTENAIAPAIIPIGFIRLNTRFAGPLVSYLDTYIGFDSPMEFVPE